MMRKKAIVIILLSLFSFQLLPVKQVGSVLYMNQLLEELPNSSESGTSKYSDEFKNLDCLLAIYHEYQPAFVSIHELQTLNDKIHSRSSDDVLTQPPNTAL